MLTLSGHVHTGGDKKRCTKGDGVKKGSGFYTRSMNGLLFPVIFSPAVLSTLSCPVMITLIILSPAVDSQHFNNERWKRRSRSKTDSEDAAA